MLEEFAALRPLAAHLRDLQRRCRPFSADYDAIAISLCQLNEMVEEITGRPNFYGSSGNHR